MSTHKLATFLHGPGRRARPAGVTLEKHKTEPASHD